MHTFRSSANFKYNFPPLRTILITDFQSSSAIELFLGGWEIIFSQSILRIISEFIIKLPRMHIVRRRSNLASNWICHRPQLSSPFNNKIGKSWFVMFLPVLRTTTACRECGQWLNRLLLTQTFFLDLLLVEEMAIHSLNVDVSLHLLYATNCCALTLTYLNSPTATMLSVVVRAGSMTEEWFKVAVLPPWLS